MVLLARFFIKEKETGIVKQITLYDARYISIEEISLWKMIKRSCRFIYFYLRRKNTVARKDMYDALRVNAEDVFGEHNKNIENTNMPPVVIGEAFNDKHSDTNTSYIG